MKVLRTLTLPAAAVALLAGCGDATGPDDPLEPFIGSWTATEFSYTAHDSDASVDLVEFGGEDAFVVTVNDDGSFNADLLMPDLEDPEGGEPTPLQLAGTLEHQGEGELRIDFDQMSEQLFQDRTVIYSFESDTRLTWEDDGASFDFDRDGTEVDATLYVDLSRD